MKPFRAVLFLAAVLAAALATSQPLPYAQSRTTIKAGTLLIESQRVGFGAGVPANVAPHLWSNLDQDSIAKPASWTFDNPLGQSAMTADAANRWGATPGAGFFPSPGNQLKKSDAAYWEIQLSLTSEDSLSQFDVLNLTVNGNLSLNTTEREKLRRFVDQGGVLWVDLVNDAGLTVDLANGLPYGFDWAVSVQPIEANLLHPVLSSPNPIRLSDLELMSYAGAIGQIVTLPIDISALPVSPLASWVTPDSRRLEPVAGNNSGRTISVAQLGEGYIVVTARGVTATLNRGVVGSQPPPRTPQVNRAFMGLEPVFDDAYGAAAKFAINVISLATSYSTPGASSRHSGGSAVTVDAPMLMRFAAPFGAGAFTPGKPAVIFKGYIVTTAAGRVTVFDADPSRDTDRDGDPDDGIPDPLGVGTDVIWQSVDLGTLSSPTVVEVPSTVLNDPSTGLAVNQIWVTDSSGTVRVFNLDTTPMVGVVPLASIGPPSGLPAGAAGEPHSVTVHESMVVVAGSRATDGLGRLWIIDLNTATVLSSTNAWALFGVSQFLPSSASATVGYIPVADSPGALDRVIYVPQQPPTLGPPRPASLTSFWLGARGEQPIRVTRLGPTVVRLATRASQQRLPLVFGGGSSSYGLKITLLKPNGDPFTLGEMQTVFSGTLSNPGTPGEIDVVLLAPGPWDYDGTTTPGDPTDDVGWRVDYTLDWGQIGALGGPSPAAFVRGNIEFPDTVANTRQIVGGAALGPQGNIFVVTAAPGAGDIGSTLFNLVEKGRGDFRLIYRYDLYDALTFNINQGASPTDTIALPPSFVDEDVLLTDLPFLNTQINSLKFVGGPAVRGSTVHCVAKGVKFGGIEVTVVMAFEANPGPLEFSVEGTSTNFTILQPDVSRSVTKTAPTTFSDMRSNQFTAERITGQNRVRIVIDNAMTNTRGRIGDSISSSLPVMIRRNGQTDTLVEPETPGTTSYGAFPGLAGGKFTPLIWYAVLNGYGATTAPVVTGDTVFTAGASMLPSLLSGGPPSTNGLMYAISAEISPNDPFLRANSVRPWHQQLTTVVKASPAPGDFIAADAIKWPQFRGAKDFDDIRIRILQAALPDSSAISLAVGYGALAVTSSSNLYGFARSDFYVVDEGRVSRFDSSGNPLWSASQTLNAGVNQPSGGSSSGVRLSRPTRMYPDPSGSNGFWIVDSGNDRVTLVDAAGRELRTIKGFRLDPIFVPQGMGDSEAKTLRDPRDVYVFESKVTAANNPLSNPQPLELWRHVIIAEAGNNRVVELVDRFALDPASGRVIGIVSYNDPNFGVQQALGVLVWHTPEELSGKRYAYNSVAFTFVDDGAGGRRRVVALGFGNVEPGRASFGLDTAPQDLDVSSGYGGIVLYDGANSRVITSFAKPAIPAGAYLAETAPGSGVFDFLTPAEPAEPEHKVAGLTSVSLRYINTVVGPRLSVMLTSSTGIYELVQPDLTQPDQWAVNWMLPFEAYIGMRRPRTAGPYSQLQIGDNPQKFQPQYARRLDSGEVLIVNGYMGRRWNATEFFGEVSLIDGRTGGAGNTPGYDILRPNLGFNSLSVVYELPPVQGIRGITRPVYAERQ